MVYRKDCWTHCDDYASLHKLKDWIINDLKPEWAAVIHIETGMVIYIYNQETK
jgi:hypothetical protein